MYNYQNLMGLQYEESQEKKNHVNSPVFCSQKVLTDFGGSYTTKQEDLHHICKKNYLGPQTKHRLKENKTLLML